MANRLLDVVLSTTHNVVRTMLNYISSSVNDRGVNVKDFGAVGDGVTDDTVAIQAAITSEGAGGNVWIPKGSYYLSAALDIPASAHGLVIQGAGRNNSILIQHADNTPIIRSNSDGIHTVRIQGLQLGYSAQQTLSDTDGYAIQFNTAASGEASHYHWILQDLWIYSAQTGIGTKASPGETLPVWGCTFRDIMITDISNNGIDLAGPVAVGQPINVMENIFFDSSGITPDGYAIMAVANELNINGLDIENWDSGALLFFSGGRPVHINGLHIEHIVNTFSNARLIEVSNNPIIIDGMLFEDFASTVTSEIFHLGTNGSLMLKGFQASSISGGGACYLVNGTASDNAKSWLENIDIPVEVTPWRSTTNERINQWDNATGYFRTFTASDTTPSVLGARVFKTANASGTSITQFDDGLYGQEITIIFGDANTTIADAGNFKLASGLSPASANTTLSLVYDGTSWYETSRSVN